MIKTRFYRSIPNTNNLVLVLARDEEVIMIETIFYRSA